MNVNADFYAKLFKKNPKLKQFVDGFNTRIHPSAGGNTNTNKTKKSKLKIEGTPGSTKGAMAAKEMAKKRIKAGKSTLGDYGSGPDRGKKAAQAKAKKLIKQGRNTVTGEKKNKKKKPKITTWRDME